MKKSLLTAALALFSAVSALASQSVEFTCSDVTLNASGYSYASFTNTTMAAFEFNLTHADWLTASVPVDSLPETGTLTSITLTFRTEPVVSNLALVIFKERKNEEQADVAHLDYVAKSDLISDPAKGELAFSFSDETTLDLSATYIFVFFCNKEAYLAMGDETTVWTGTSVKDIIDDKAAVVHSSSAPLYSPNLSLYEVYSSHASASYQDSGHDRHDIVPEITISVQIPEPTVATLSLLALTGLAARRRRK